VLLESCLEVLDEFFIEDLIEALNEIVHVFYEEIIPYSIQVCEKLSEAYEEIMVQLGQEDFDMNDSKQTTTANGCVNAIYRIITSIGSQTQDNKKEVLYKIQETVHQVLLNSLDPRFQDVHESILNCIGAIAFYNEEITQNMWELFPSLLEVLYYNIEKTCEYGLVSPGISAIMNYMQKDPDTFIGQKMQNGETPFEAVVKLINKTITDSHISNDFLLHKTGSELVIGLLENLHGRIDDSLPFIIELLVQEINEKNDRCTKLLIIQALAMCFAYNTELTFRALEEKNWTQGVFHILFEALPDAKYDFEIQRLILGILEIISCTTYQLPDIVVQAMPEIFKELVVLCQKSIYTKEQKSKSGEDKDQELREKAYNILDDWSDEDEYDDDDEYDPDEARDDNEELYKSFTQEVNEVQRVKEVFASLDPGLYSAYFEKVSREDQNALQDCVSSPLASN
jgi:importin-7